MANKTRYNSPMATALPAEPDPSPGVRKRRFQASAERVPFQLTDADIDMIRAVAHHRMLTSRQLQKLFPRSEQYVLRRLNGLFHSGYLDRPPHQLDYYRAGGGSSPMVYALADRGAQLINRLDNDQFVEDLWQQKNNTTRPFIQHTIGVAGIDVALVAATRRRKDVALITARELIAAFPKPPVSYDRAFTWHADVRQDGQTYSVPVKCDLPFALRSAAIGRRAYLCEYDRGTMPIIRPHFNQTSILRKFAGYIAGHNQKLHEIQFGWKAYRVLFIAISKKRAHNMREALAEYTTQPNDRARFYFTSADEIASADILSLPWVDGNGTEQTLI